MWTRMSWSWILHRLNVDRGSDWSWGGEMEISGALDLRRSCGEKKNPATHGKWENKIYHLLFCSLVFLWGQTHQFKLNISAFLNLISILYKNAFISVTNFYLYSFNTFSYYHDQCLGWKNKGSFLHCFANFIRKPLLGSSMERMPGWRWCF